MALSNIEITESLFQSVEVIVDQKMKTIECDITDLCVIVDDSNAKNGIYWVSTNNGATKYKAISESSEYKKNEKVRVSIPKGDYSGDKYIIGKCVDDELIMPITYISPLDTVIDVTGNLLSETKQKAQFDLVANGIKQQVPIWSADLSLDENYKDLQATGIYNTIALQANFRTLLGDYTIKSGSYGLRLDIYVRLNPTSNKYILRSVYLDSSEMFGDPYNFLIESPQSKKFDLSKIGTVDKLSLWFYQKGDFTYYNTKERKTLPVPHSIENPGGEKYDLPSNLFVKNINIAFGSDISIIEDNTLQGYSLDSRKYRYISTEEDNLKRIGFLWYNKDENNSFIGFNDGLVDFELDDDDKIKYTAKKDADGNDIGEQFLNEYGNPIEEFKRDEDGKIILDKYFNIVSPDNPQKTFITFEFNESGEDEEEQFLTIEEEKEAVKQEVEILKNSYYAKLEANIITLDDYNNIEKDINDYKNDYTAYLNKYITDCKTYLQNLQIYNNAIKDGKEPPFEEVPVPPEPIFKKTYILQNKITPFLVQKVKPYDEIEYLEKTESDSRLVAQMGKEGVPTNKESLNFSANLIEAKPLLLKNLELVTKDLVSALRAFNQRTGLISGDFKDMLSLLLTSATQDKNKVPYTDEQTLNVWNTETKKIIDNLYDVCEQYLLINYRNQENLKLIDEEKEVITFSDDEKELKEWYEGTDTVIAKVDLCQLLSMNFTKLYTMIDNFLAKAESEIKDSYSGYQGIFDTYNSKILKILQVIKNNVTKSLDELLVDCNTILSAFNVSNLDSMEYLDYSQKDFSDSDNRYSIYWYRYELGYVDENDRLIKTDWKRLKTEEDFGIKQGSTELVYNFGLPIYDEFIKKDGEYYFAHKALETNTLLRRMMDGNLKEEKYKIILFYNHEMYESEEIVFSNLDEVPDTTTVDKTDAIVIKHGENSQETYQNYDTNNYLHNLADASKNRTISVHYEGLKTGDEFLAEAQVYWYIPNANTMLNYDDNYLTTVLNFASDKNIEADKKPDYSKEGYTCYYKKIEKDTVEIEDDPNTEEDESGEKTVPLETDLNFVYKIKDYYVSTASRNEILCKIEKDGYTFETEIMFSFTSFGTSGTDYTLTITPATAQSSIQADKPLTLNIALYDYKNDKIPIKEDLLSSNGASDFKIEWEGPDGYYEAGEILYGEDNSVTGVNILMPDPPKTEEDRTFGIMKVSTTCPIEYQNTLIDDDDVDEDEEEQIDKTKTRDVKLISFYPIPYSAGDYYIEGATTVIYDSTGANPVYYKDPYKIFKTNTNEDLSLMSKPGAPDKKHYDVKWKTVYYKKSKVAVEKQDPETGEIKQVYEATKLTSGQHQDYELCRKYMPYLNKKNALAVSTMHIDNVDCWCAVECWVKDYTKASAGYSLIWSQPILILKNRYPSPMLNSWDGNFMIDKTNGTILSTLMGAGKKTSHNTFEGVLMGAVEENADIIDPNSSTGMGLYGFNDGAQSFGFRIDGTGFIGKSGRARIEFDGKAGTIQSSSYSSDTLKPTGMKIDLDDGSIDLRGSTEFNEQEWINLIISKYEKIFDGNTIKDSAIPLATQAALLKVIKQDAKNIAYLNSAAVVSMVTENQKTKFALMEERIKEAPAKYYALSSLRRCKWKREFEFTEEVEGVGPVTTVYPFTQKQYKTVLKHVDEYILSETYDGLWALDETGSRVDNYKKRYGKLSMPLLKEDKKGHQSQVHIDVKSPYFYVITEDGKRIINIGDTRDKTDPYKPLLNWEKYDPAEVSGSWLEPNGSNLKKSYYLKSQNFTPTIYDNKGNLQTEGDGTVFDLDSGYLNSYHFSLQSKFLYIDGWAGEKYAATKKEPFFILKDEKGNNLLYASTSTYVEGETKKLGDFYLQSSAYATYATYDALDDSEKEIYEGTPPSPGGTKIDIAKGKIRSYDFSLKGVSTKSGYEGSYIQLDSSPSIVVSLTKQNDDDDGSKAHQVKLLNITPTKFVMHSNDWGEYKETIVEEAKTGKGTIAGGPWKIRRGPGTDKEETGTKATAGQKYTIYEIGTGKDNSSNSTWYRVGKKQWITARAFTSVTKPTSGSTDTITYTQGMEFNINKSVLKLYRGHRALRIAANDIDNKDQKYGIYLGEYDEDTGETTWNLRLGWDGTIKGNGWTLDKDGWRKD